MFRVTSSCCRPWPFLRGRRRRWDDPSAGTWSSDPSRDGSVSRPLPGSSGSAGPLLRRRASPGQLLTVDLAFREVCHSSPWRRKGFRPMWHSGRSGPFDRPQEGSTAPPTPSATACSARTPGVFTGGTATEEPARSDPGGGCARRAAEGTCAPDPRRYPAHSTDPTRGRQHTVRDGVRSRRRRAPGRRRARTDALTASPAPADPPWTRARAVAQLGPSARPVSSGRATGRRGLASGEAPPGRPADGEGRPRPG